MQKLKKPLSILLAVLMVMSVFIAVPMSASALTIDDVQSLLSSMEAKINDYNAQGDWDRAGALKDYYDWLDEELEYADGQITPELESAYNEAYEYFMANSGSGVSYPDVNNVYRATNEPVDVTVSDLQPGDVIVTSSAPLAVRKGDCNIVLVGGTYGEGDAEEGTLSRTYPNDVTLGNDLSFHFSGNYARIMDGDNYGIYDPVYNNALGNAYMVLGNENGTVYLAGYNFVTYTVTWKNDDGTTIDTTTVKSGVVPTHADPTKAEDEQYTYTFSGWTPEITAVTGDVTYTATAKTKPWTYNITTGGEYTCPSTLSQYTIVSGGTEENPVIINITGSTTVNYPICLLSGYLKIVGNNNTFSGDRGFVFFSELASYKPNGEAHLTVTDLTIISNNATNQYIQISSQNYKCQSTFENVTFKNCNINGSGAVVIGSETTHTFKNCTFEDITGYNAGGISFRYGSDVTMEGCTFKNCTRTRPYNTSFLGGGAVWLERDTKLTLDGCTFENCTGECGAVGIVSTATLTLKGNTTITGNSSGNLYLPTGATVKIDEDFIGTVGVTTQTAPTDSASVTLSSDLADTQSALANKNIVSDNENYGVIYKDNSLLLINSKVYTVTWKNDDGTTIDTTTVKSGVVPTHADPTKAEDEKYTYTFAGWTPEVVAATADATYTATFDATFKGVLSGDLRKGLVIDAGTPIRFAMSKTADSWTILVLQVYLDDVLVKSVQTEQFQPTEPDRYYTTTKKCIVDSYSGTGGYPRAYHTLRLKSLYTVTWQNDDGTTLETDVDVVAGKTPTYNGTTPTKAEDENYTYTFAGWSPEITAVTGDVTYTAQFDATAKPKDLFPQHSITLGGNIGVNFYIDSAAADFANASTAVVKFTWDNGNYHEEVDLKALTPDTSTGYYKATVDVVAAHMAHEIHAEVYLDGEKLDQTDDYSVKEYAETVYANPAEYDSEKPEQLKALAQALLNYGANAQTVFDSALTEKPELANKTVGNNGYADVTAEQIAAAINDEASDLNAIAEQLGAKYYTNSLIYLSKNTLRIYFTPTSYPGEIPNAGAYDGNLSGYYYYVDHANIPAAELDNQQTFNVNGTEFTFSALDYAKAVVESTKMEPDQKNLAKSLYLYNQKANAYFDAAPAPVQKILVLDGVNEDTTVEDGYTITGTLKGDYKISIADGATVTLKDATITSLTNAAYAGINPVGDATILLEGENTVKGGHRRMPGIYIPANKTLTIDGTGSLVAYSGGDFSATSSSNSPASCGIGGKRNVSNGGAVAGGNLVINGGTITAYGGLGCAGIGSCATNGIISTKMFGDITINGGTVTASALDNAAGIGSGKGTPCGNITITGGTVTATGDGYAAGIGGGWNSNCGDITIAGTVTQVTATKGEDAPNSIGAGKSGTCGTVTIEDGANVIQN